MDKNVKNMLITACVCLVIGFGYGYKSNTIANGGTEAEHVTEILANGNTELNNELLVCEGDRNEWEHRFNIAMSVNEDLGVAAKKSTELTGRCINELKRASGLL